MIFLLATALILWSIMDPRRSAWVYAAFVALIVALFAAMNMNKVPTGDWVWYIEHYRRLQYMPFLSYLGARIGWITIKWNEPFYYLICKIVSVYSGANIPTLAFVITLIDFGTVGWAIYRIGSDIFREEGRRTEPLMLVAALLLSVSFTLVAQLVRQEMAACICILGYSFLRRRQYVPAAIIVLLAVLSHQSVLVLALILSTPALIDQFLSRRRLLRRAAIFLAVATVAVIGFAVAHSDIAAIGQKNDGYVSLIIVVFDLLVFCGLIAVMIKDGYKSSTLRHAILSYLLFYAAIISMASVPLAALRLYFYIDLVRAISVLYLCARLMRPFPRKLDSVIFGITMLAAGLAYVHFRIERSPFEFNGTMISYVLYPA